MSVYAHFESTLKLTQLPSSAAFPHTLTDSRPAEKGIAPPAIDAKC